MVSWFLVVAGSGFAAVGTRALAAAEESSWVGAIILPGGLIVLGLGVLGVLIPGFLPASLW